MLVKGELRKIIEKAINDCKFNNIEVAVSYPKEKKFGDYSSNCALEIAKEQKKNPISIAEEIKFRIEKNRNFKKIFKKIEIEKPGFLNFFLDESFLQKELNNILKQGYGFGELNIGKKKKIQVEFVSANPTGPLTVGNSRGGPFGDTLANVLRKVGFNVEKAYYVNDYGNQITTLGHSVLKDEEAKYKGEYIDFLHGRIGEERDPYAVGKWASNIILNELIEPVVKKMGIEYDEWFFESELYNKKKVHKVLEFLKSNNFTYEKDGAVWFKSESFGDERDRVLLKSNGQPTYLLGDIAYHQYKFKEKKFDKVINVWGADHLGDVPGLKAGVEAIGFKDKLEIILLQFVTLFDKGEKMRMSKREGVYVTMADLLNDVDKDVVRFFFLQKSANTHLNFDLKLAQEHSDKNPVYYVQYAHARICSIFKNAKVDYRRLRKAGHSKHLKSETELELIKKILNYPEIIEETANDYQLQRLSQYAIELANLFHRFYKECKIIGEDKNILWARLELIVSVKNTLKSVLEVMGISAPDKM